MFGRVAAGVAVLLPLMMGVALADPPKVVEHKTVVHKDVTVHRDVVRRPAPVRRPPVVVHRPGVGVRPGFGGRPGFAGRPGIAPRRWAKGGRFYGTRRVFTDYDRYHVRRPPPGYEWVQDDNQLALIAITTGIIADTFYISLN